MLVCSRWDPTKTLFEQFAASDLSAINATTEPVGRDSTFHRYGRSLTEVSLLTSSNPLNPVMPFHHPSSLAKKRWTGTRSLSYPCQPVSTSATDRSR